MEAPRRRDWKPYLLLSGVGALLLAGGSAVAFYGEEVRVYLAGGWNRHAIRGTAETFVQRVQLGDHSEAMELLEPSRYRPVQREGRLAGIEKVDPSGLSPETHLFQGMFPAGEPRVTGVEWRNADGGAFLVSLAFPDGGETRFLVAGDGAKFRIVGYLGSYSPGRR